VEGGGGGAITVIVLLLGSLGGVEDGDPLGVNLLELLRQLLLGVG